MTVSIVYVAHIYGLKIPSDPGSGFEVLPGLNITNKFREVERHLDGSFFPIIGALESSDLRNAEAIVYTLGDSLGVTENDFIVSVATYVSVFLHSLWLIKDHSAYPGLGFVQRRDGENISVHSNTLASNLTDATGQRSTVGFTRKELRDSAEFMIKLLPLFRYDFRLRPSSGSALLGSQRDAKRVGRAIYFASVARGQMDLGVKIVNYCTALESLFSTDSTELTHKVAQRAAVFMSSIADERIATYDFIKKAYAVRSKVVHGDTLSKDAPERITPISQNLDNLIRNVLAKIFSSPELTKRFEAGREDLDRYFLQESFS